MKSDQVLFPIHLIAYAQYVGQLHQCLDWQQLVLLVETSELCQSIENEVRILQPVMG
jgi:hypothetical protein